MKSLFFPLTKSVLVLALLLLSYLKVFLCKQCDTLNSNSLLCTCSPFQSLMLEAQKVSTLWQMGACRKRSYLVAQKEGIIIITSELDISGCPKLYKV